MNQSYTLNSNQYYNDTINKLIQTEIKFAQKNYKYISFPEKENKQLTKILKVATKNTGYLIVGL